MGVKEAELAYGRLAHLLRDITWLNARRIENTALYQQLKDLTRMAQPTQKDKYDTKWLYFYVPLQFQRKEALIPMGVVEYKGDYFVGFSSTDHLQHLQVKMGERACSTIYGQIVSSAAEFVPRLTDAEALERKVPYDFRTGRIKGKYVMDKDKLMPKETAKKIRERYHIHSSELPLVGRKISLDDYLGAVSVAEKAAFPETKEMTPLKAYQTYADFRHGGMLDIKNSASIKEFNDWLESDRWSGSHPFEIVFGQRRYGIEFWPPRPGRMFLSAEDKYFVLSVGDRPFSKMYLRMLNALIQENVPVVAPQLDEVLQYLQGESYFRVNELMDDYVYHDEVDKKYFKHIKWNRLEVVKPTGPLEKRTA